MKHATAIALCAALAASTPAIADARLLGAAYASLVECGGYSVANANGKRLIDVVGSVKLYNEEYYKGSDYVTGRARAAEAKGAEAFKTFCENQAYFFRQYFR